MLTVAPVREGHEPSLLQESQAGPTFKRIVHRLRKAAGNWQPGPPVRHLSSNLTMALANGVAPVQNPIKEEK